MRFVNQPVNTESALANKIWRVSRILGDASPFEDKIMDLSEPQMTFILEMYIKDNPDELRLVRGGKENLIPMVMKNWTEVLRGKALMECMMNPVGYLKKYFGFDFNKSK
jgi:hypothetical protein